MSTFKKAEKLGRQAWLASLGAYGAGWKYAVDKFDKTYTQTNSLVNDLITEGEKIEKEIQDKVKAKVVIDEKVAVLKSKLGLSETSETERIEQLSQLVDSLTEAVNKLAESKATKATKAKKSVKAKKLVKTSKVVSSTKAKS